MVLDYNATKANETGDISILWTDKNAEAKSFDKDEVLFTIVLKPLTTEGQLLTDLQLNNNLATTEAWDNNFSQRNIVLSNKEIYNLPLNNNQLLIYPNPSKSNVTIKTTEARELFIIDYLGRIISKQSINNKSSILNIKLNAGIYVVRAIMNDGSSKNEKLVIE